MRPDSPTTVQKSRLWYRWKTPFWVDVLITSYVVHFGIEVGGQWFRNPEPRGDSWIRLISDPVVLALIDLPGTGLLFYLAYTTRGRHVPPLVVGGVLLWLFLWRVVPVLSQ